jgi:hypothetical protein
MNADSGCACSASRSGLWSCGLVVLSLYFTHHRITRLTFDT